MLSRLLDGGGSPRTVRILVSQHILHFLEASVLGLLGTSGRAGGEGGENYSVGAAGPRKEVSPACLLFPFLPAGPSLACVVSPWGMTLLGEGKESPRAD